MHFETLQYCLNIVRLAEKDRALLLLSLDAHTQVQRSFSQVMHLKTFLHFFLQLSDERMRTDEKNVVNMDRENDTDIKLHVGENEESTIKSTQTE